jgi:hypothetical protein
VALQKKVIGSIVVSNLIKVNYYLFAVTLRNPNITKPELLRREQQLSEAQSIGRMGTLDVAHW